MEVVKMKNVINKKPRSTMGVRSMFVDLFLYFRAPALDLSLAVEVISSDIKNVLIHSMTH